MRKMGKKILCTIMVLTVLMSSFLMDFESKALEVDWTTGRDFFVDYPEPTASDKQGYITLLLYNPTNGQYSINTWFWNGHMKNVFENQVVDEDFSLDISLSNSTITFDVWEFIGVETLQCSIFSINNSGLYRYRGLLHTHGSTFSYTYSNAIIVGMKYKGNVFRVSMNNVDEQFTINFNQEGNSILLQDQLEMMFQMYSQDVQMLSRITSIMNSNQSIDDKLSELIELEEENNTWLEKIWKSIQRLFKGDNPEDDAKSEEFGNSSTQQSDKISELNEQNKTEKVDVDKTSSDVDANIDAEAIGNYGTVLAVFTSDAHILQLILIVLSVALISYVLFGKR